MSPVVIRLTVFVVIEKPPSHYVLHIDEGFYFPTGLFLHHVTNSKRVFFSLGFPPYVDKL
jgi:hypothetical protein